MLPTDILSHEHRVIEQVLSALERLTAQAERDGRLAGPNACDARDAVDFFRHFADQCHHGKEEAHLFPAMEAKGFPREGGPTGVMLLEHDQGRAFVRGMADAIPAAETGDPAALARYAANARGYIDLLRNHIEKEDHCLFAMANQAFSPAEQQALLERFEHVEAHEMGEGAHERYLAIAHRLAEAYGVPSTPESHPGGCCHHHSPGTPIS